MTGATGTVGHPIAARLAAEGNVVRALVRDTSRAAALLPEGVEAVPGDVTDTASVRAALRDAEVVYHAAGLPEQWRLDPGDFDRVNAAGTRNVVDAALGAGVARFVYTSTIDVLAWTPGVPFDESTIDPRPRPTSYERSKQVADAYVTAALDRGLPAVFLHPSAVYGPAPVLTGLNDLLVRLAQRKIPRLLPGGMPAVHAADVAEGHLRAAETAAVGERFVLSAEYLTLAELAQAVRREVPRAKVPPVMPIRLARALSVAGERVAKVTRRPPLIPRGALHFLESHPVPDAGKAARELGWTPRPFADGLPDAVAGYRAAGWI